MSRRRDYIIPSAGASAPLRWTVRIHVAGDDDADGAAALVESAVATISVAGDDDADGAAALVESAVATISVAGDDDASGAAALDGLTAPTAPTISGTVSIGSALTITPGAGGGPVTSYTLYRNGVSAGTVTSGYLFVAADLAPTTVGGAPPSLTVKAVGPGGTSAASNALAYALPTTSLVGDYDATHVTLVSGRVSAILKQGGSGNDLTNGTAGTRPTQSVGGGPNGLDALDFSLNAGAVTFVAQGTMGLGATTTIYTVVQMPASVRYVCDGFTADTRVVVANAGATTISMYAGASGPQIPAPAVGAWHVSACVFNVASSKGDINGGTTATGNVGAATSGGHWLGSRATGTATTGLEKLWARQRIYSVAHTDSERADMGAYLKGWAGL